MKRSVIIEADKARNLRFGINSLCKMEELLGKPLAELSGSTSINDLRVMFYCGLFWEDKELTIEKAGNVMDDMISAQGIEYLQTKIEEAMNLAIGEKKQAQVK